MTVRPVVSFLGLQLGWFACVLGATHGHAWFGPAFVLATLALHVRLQPSNARTREAAVLASTALVGFLVDTALLRSGMIELAGAGLSPAWLVALWPNFAAATAPGGSLGGLARRPLLAALLGAVAAPLAYAGGARLGALGLDRHPVGALAAIAVVWSGVLPSLFALRALVGAPREVRRAP